jgi:hypothetical protein
MTIHPNEVKTVQLTNYEIIVMVNLIKKTVPELADQITVINIVNKLTLAMKT